MLELEIIQDSSDTALVEQSGRAPHSENVFSTTTLCNLVIERLTQPALVENVFSLVDTNDNCTAPTV